MKPPTCQLLVFYHYVVKPSQLSSSRLEIIALYFEIKALNFTVVNSVGMSLKSDAEYNIYFNQSALQKNKDR